MIFRDDRLLLDAFRRGETRAFERVYDRYVDLVATVIRRGAFSGMTLYGAPRHAWQDLVQEVFSRAFAEKTRLSFDGLRDYQPFLLAITRNVLAGYWRQRGREIPQEDFDTLPAEDTHSDFERRHLQLAHDYIATLPEELKAVYEARFAEGHSQYEAAEKLGSTRQRIRTLEEKIISGLGRLLGQKSNPK